MTPIVSTWIHSSGTRNSQIYNFMDFWKNNLFLSYSFVIKLTKQIGCTFASHYKNVLMLFHLLNVDENYRKSTHFQITGQHHPVEHCILTYISHPVVPTINCWILQPSPRLTSSLYTIVLGCVVMELVLSNNLRIPCPSCIWQLIYCCLVCCNNSTTMSL